MNNTTEIKPRFETINEEIAHVLDNWAMPDKSNYDTTLFRYISSLSEINKFIGDRVQDYLNREELNAIGTGIINTIYDHLPTFFEQKGLQGHIIETAYILLEPEILKALRSKPVLKPIIDRATVNLSLDESVTLLDELDLDAIKLKQLEDLFPMTLTRARRNRLTTLAIKLESSEA